MKGRDLLEKWNYKKMNLLSAVKISFEVLPGTASLLVLLTMLSSVVPVIQVYAIAGFIDTALAVINHTAQIKQALPAATAILFLTAYNWLSDSLTELLWKKLSLRLSETFRISLVEKCAKLKYTYYEDKDAQECITRVIQQAENSITNIFKTLCQAWILIINVVGIVAIIMSKSFWVAILILVISVPLMILARKSGDTTYKVNQKNTKYERQYNYLGDVLRRRESALERTLFGYTEPLSDKWNEVYGQSAKYIQKAYRNWYLKIEMGSILTALVSVSGVAILLVPVVQGTMSVGIYISLVNACFTLIGVMSWQLRGIVENLARENGLKNDINRILSFEEEEGAITSLEKPMSFHTIRFQNVSFRYPNGSKYILRNLSFEIEAGKHYAIVGYNGEGKSTIIKLLLGFYDSYEGQIFIDEMELRSLDPIKAKSLFSVVYQDFAAYQISLMDSIQLGSAKPISTEKISEVIQDLRLEGMVASLPNGVDTPLGRILEGARDISGGQWQRIAIARCAVNQAPVRVLDEPTAALDPTMESEIYESFSKISDHKTTIMISHRLGSTKLVDEILVLKQGKIVEKGSHQKLMDQNGLYREMFESQRSWYL